MIHTDGKPTIANTRLVHHRDVNPDSTCGGWVTDGHKLFGTDYWCVYCGAKFNAPSCSCAKCSENDPDSMPGGYDNPQEPYDWSDDA